MKNLQKIPIEMIIITIKILPRLIFAKGYLKNYLFNTKTRARAFLTLVKIKFIF